MESSGALQMLAMNLISHYTPPKLDPEAVLPKKVRLTLMRRFEPLRGGAKRPARSQESGKLQSDAAVEHRSGKAQVQNNPGHRPNT